MQSICTISKKIYPVCFDVDNSITGLPAVEAEAWGHGNSVRHAHTIRAVLDHAARTGKRHLRILNASGLSCGHQDFSIVSYLRECRDFSFEWVVYESPKSVYPENSKFRAYLNDLDIKVKLSDFSKNAQIFTSEEGTFDVVIFTEIAEHLDHSILLKTLAELYAVMNDDGVLIVTTPNLVSAVNRIKLFMGNGDGPYWGDGQLNSQQGLFGHIVNYDPRRIARILRDAGFVVQKTYTFNYAYRSLKQNPLQSTAMLLLDLLSNLVPDAGGTLFVAAGKGEPVRIPAQT